MVPFGQADFLNVYLGKIFSKLIIFVDVCISVHTFYFMVCYHYFLKEKEHLLKPTEELLHALYT